MYMRKNCNCGANNNMCCNTNETIDNCYDDDRNNMYQKACSNAENFMTANDYCDCGFEEDNSYFPENPMFAQSYVPIQTMDKVFIPSVRIKNGNYLSRTC